MIWGNAGTTAVNDDSVYFVDDTLCFVLPVGEDHHDRGLLENLGRDDRDGGVVPARG